MSHEKKILRVVGCLIEHDTKILMLYRSETETDPSLWGIPAGKVEGNELDVDAVLREIYEETSIVIRASDVKNLGELKIEYPNMVVLFPVFGVQLLDKPTVVIDSNEHIEYRWLTPEEILKLPDLMKDVDVIIERFCINKS